jgi:hypothetical protein
MILFLACCVLLLSLWLILLQRLNTRLKADMVMMQERHRQDYADFIAKVNHEGPVPIVSTVLGLISVVSLGHQWCLSKLQDLRKNKDWDTTSVTQGLFEITTQELVMLEDQFKKFMLSIRKVLEDHNHKQEP